MESNINSTLKKSEHLPAEGNALMEEELNIPLPVQEIETRLEAENIITNPIEVLVQVECTELPRSVVSDSEEYHSTERKKRKLERKKSDAAAIFNKMKMEAQLQVLMDQVRDLLIQQKELMAQVAKLTSENERLKSQGAKKDWAEEALESAPMECGNDEPKPQRPDRKAPIANEEKPSTSKKATTSENSEGWTTVTSKIPKSSGVKTTAPQNSKKVEVKTTGAVPKGSRSSTTTAGTKPTAAPKVIGTTAAGGNPPVKIHTSDTRAGTQATAATSNKIAGKTAAGATATAAPKRIMANTSVSNDTNTANRPTTINKDKSAPSFTVFGVELRKLVEAMEKKLPKEKYQIKMVKKSVLSVRVKGIEDFTIVKEILQEGNFAFYTHTPKALRPYAVVIHGLSSEYSPDEVKNFLQTTVSFPMEILSVSSFADDKWLLRLSKSTDIMNVYKINRILHCVVKCRKDRGREVTQCYNCQRFGHVASNCGMTYRCVKCGDSHGPANCPIAPRMEDGEPSNTTEEEAQVFCINCNAQGHVASSRTCPKRISFLKKRTQRKHTKPAVTTARPSVGPTHISDTRPNVSYASAAGARHVPPPARGNSASQGNAFADDCFTFFGKSLLELLADIRAFAPKFIQIRDAKDRATAIVHLLLHINGL